MVKWFSNVKQNLSTKPMKLTVKRGKKPLSYWISLTMHVAYPIGCARY